MPSALVTSGIFGFTRNPIYLGDAFVLLAACLWWQAPIGLLLVPIFGLIIQTRFIKGEEAALRQAFGQQFADWSERVRRWI
jgi:protein-S-isoprenylcysteine O-methyltransferase Ste14